jgi:hypothetical protein
MMPLPDSVEQLIREIEIREFHEAVGRSHTAVQFLKARLSADEYAHLRGLVYCCETPSEASLPCIDHGASEGGESFGKTTPIEYFALHGAADELFAKHGWDLVSRPIKMCNRADGSDVSYEEITGYIKGALFIYFDSNDDCDVWCINAPPAGIGIASFYAYTQTTPSRLFVLLR